MVDQFIAPWWASLPEPAILVLSILPVMLAWLIAYLCWQWEGYWMLYPIVGITLVAICWLLLPWSTVSWIVAGGTGVLFPVWIIWFGVEWHED